MTSIRTIILPALLAPAAAAAQLTCATAVPVGLGAHTAPQVTGTAPTPLCVGGAAASYGLWYVFTPAQSMTVTVSSSVSGYPNVDTRLHVYTGTCGALTCVAGDDDSGPGYTSITTFNVTGGTAYYLAWDSYWNANGFTFTILQAPPLPQGMVQFSTVTIPGFSGLQGLVDMDGDGKDDAVAPGQTGFTVAYQRNAGAFDVVNFPTSSAANTASWSFTVADWDGNGYRDLLYGGGSGATFMTANSDGSQYTQWSPPQYIFSQRANFVDLNNDGHLDAFVCHDTQASVAFINDGAGQLTFTQGGYGSTCGNYGSIFVDMDNDGDMDLFIAKCGCDPADLLMLNDGQGHFTNMAPSLGLADSHPSWSSAWGDFDNDGDMDVLIGSSGGDVHRLLWNNGDGTFIAAMAGNGMDTWAGQSIEWTAHDFNNDGWIDILGGGALHYNNGDRTFSHDPGAPGNFAVGDVNNDGFLDIGRSNGYSKNMGNGNHWIRFNLQGTGGNRDAIGARVTIHSALGTQIREIRSGDGFRYMSFIGAHFGLGSDTEVDLVTIRWPNGQVETIEDPAINTVHNVVQGLTTGIAAEEAPAISVQPNPADDRILITGVAPEAPVEVLDAAGKLVLSGQLHGGSLSVASLESGAYLARVIEAQGLRVARFTVR